MKQTATVARALAIAIAGSASAPRGWIRAATSADTVHDTAATVVRPAATTGAAAATIAARADSASYQRITLLASVGNGVAFSSTLADHGAGRRNVDNVALTTIARRQSTVLLYQNGP